jgi:hypothetical protein
LVAGPTRNPHPSKTMLRRHRQNKSVIQDGATEVIGGVQLLVVSA